MSISVAGTGLGKTFNRRAIFSDISFELKTGQTLVITGRNGAGKSTLLKIVAGILSPTSGSIAIVDGHGRRPSLYNTIGFVSPYLNLYDEFSPVENLQFAMNARSLTASSGVIDTILERVGLARVRDIPARVFSSGMKQRLKYAFALIHAPAVLLLDEPTSNLDDEGKVFVRQVMAEQTERGILMVATNEKTDVGSFDHSIVLGRDR